MTELDMFESLRPRLFSIAYRMLGSANDAEDVLQDAWMRLSGVETHDVRSPQALATTIVTRLCLDRLKSARAKREEYIGPWLPEPVLTTDGEYPDAVAERSESVKLAFLLLLEALSAQERAVFLLKEVFDYEHAEIARMLEITIANSRQLFHRARAKVKLSSSADFFSQPRQAGSHRSRSKTMQAEQREEHRAVAARFAEAFQSGNPAELAELLAADVAYVADGGGKAVAARRPLAGRDLVVNLFLGFYRSAHASGIASQATLDVLEVNSQPALALRIRGELDGVFVFSVAEGTISSIQVIRNPDKLAYLKRQLAAR